MIHSTCNGRHETFNGPRTARESTVTVAYGITEKNADYEIISIADSSRYSDSDILGLVVKTKRRVRGSKPNYAP